MPTLLDSSLSIFDIKTNNNFLDFPLLSNNSIPSTIRSLNNLTQQISSSNTAINQNLFDSFY